MKIFVIGTEGAGKTVFISMLSRHIAHSDALVMEPSDYRSSSYVISAQEKLSNGMWPSPSKPGEMTALSWKLGAYGGELDELVIVDAAGHDLRSVLLEEEPSRLSEFQRGVREEIDASDILIYLLDLESFLGTRELSVINENAWVFKSFLTCRHWQSKKRMVVISKADLYAHMLNGTDPRSFIKSQIPRNLSLNHLIDGAGDIKYKTVVNVTTKTILNSKNEPERIPDKDKLASDGMDAVVDFIMLGRQLTLITQKVQSEGIRPQDIEFLRKYAAAGYADAQNSLGICFRNGTGIQKDEKKAFECFKKSSDQGYVQAFGNIADCYLKGIGTPKDEKKAFKLFSKAADQGCVESYIFLADCYRKGHGVAKDEKKAFEFYLKASDLGSSEAQYRLGLCCLNGTGVAKNKKKAFEYCQKAAGLGNAEAQCWIGSCYQAGNGVPKDEKKAVEYYRMAADQGNIEALNSLGLCYSKGIGTPKDNQKAFDVYLKAAGNGNPEALFWVGTCYQNGTGVPRDERKAVEYYFKAAESGNADAQNALGFCYNKGIGVPRDDRKSFEYYQKAAENGCSPAMYNVSICYKKGIGVQKDERKVLEYYQKMK